MPPAPKLLPRPSPPVALLDAETLPPVDVAVVVATAAPPDSVMNPAATSSAYGNASSVDVADARQIGRGGSCSPYSWRSEI